MKRIIMHWTGGPYQPTKLDKHHYHFIIAGDGSLHLGDFPVVNNEKCIQGNYAAHTLNCNTGSIGISMACMLDAVENKTFGRYPMTKTQFHSMCRIIANLCKVHGIPVTPTTVLSHAEVQGTLKIKQKGKWDFTVIPFMPELKGAKACGDYARAVIVSYMQPNEAVELVVKATPRTELKIGWLRSIILAISLMFSKEK